MLARHNWSRSVFWETHHLMPSQMTQTLIRNAICTAKTAICISRKCNLHCHKTAICTIRNCNLHCQKLQFALPETQQIRNAVLQWVSWGSRESDWWFMVMIKKIHRSDWIIVKPHYHQQFAWNLGLIAWYVDWERKIEWRKKCVSKETVFHCISTIPLWFFSWNSCSWIEGNCSLLGNLRSSSSERVTIQHCRTRAMF